MHTRGYLDPGDFRFVHDSSVRSREEWRVELAQRPRKLVAQAEQLLPADLRVADADTTRSTFHPVAIDDFLWIENR